MVLEYQNKFDSTLANIKKELSLIWEKLQSELCVTR